MEEVEYTMNKLIFPQTRLTIVAALATLADTDFQQQVWLGRQAAISGKCYNFDEVLHCIYDDSGLDDGPSTCIGYFLYNPEEASSLQALMTQIDLLLERHGKRLPDDAYLRAPQWPDIVASAKSTLTLFQNNDRRFQGGG